MQCTDTVHSISPSIINLLSTGIELIRHLFRSFAKYDHIQRGHSHYVYTRRKKFSRFIVYIDTGYWRFCAFEIYS